MPLWCQATLQKFEILYNIKVFERKKAKFNTYSQLLGFVKDLLGLLCHLVFSKKIALKWSLDQSDFAKESLITQGTSRGQIFQETLKIAWKLSTVFQNFGLNSEDNAAQSCPRIKERS